MTKILFVIMFLFIICLTGCCAAKVEVPNYNYEAIPEYGVTNDAMDGLLEPGEEYTKITEGGFISPERVALSSFSLDSSRYRQYVHLSIDIDTAITVGKRRDDKPVLLAIDTVSAAKTIAIILFYQGKSLDNI